MIDLARAHQEARSLPDDVLQQAIANPDGMLPGYLAMSELADRKALRGTHGGKGKRPSMAQEMMMSAPQQFQSPYRAPSAPSAPQTPRFSGGGLASLFPRG